MPKLKHEIKRMAITALVKAPYNPRRISPEALKGLTASIKRFGLVQPIIMNKRTGYVVGGHQRIEAMKAAGETQADVVVVDLSEKEEKALNITLNNAAITGEFTDDLQDILLELKEEMPDDFSELMMDDLLTDALKEGETDPDDIPLPPDRPTARRGQIWQLGNHRLMCGDSASASDVDQLLNGARIHLVNTDPPYNVCVEPRSTNAIAAGNSSFPRGKGRSPAKARKQMRPKDRMLLNDTLSDVAFEQMLDNWFGHISRALLPGRAFYIWGGVRQLQELPDPSPQGRTLLLPGDHLDQGLARD